MNLTLENLEICINAAKENKAKYFAVLVDIVNSEGPEIIVNEFKCLQIFSADGIELAVQKTKKDKMGRKQ